MNVHGRQARYEHSTSLTETAATSKFTYFLLQITKQNKTKRKAEWAAAVKMTTFLDTIDLRT